MTRLRVQRKQMEVVASVQIAKGDVYLPWLSLVSVENGSKLLVVQHKKGRYPMSSDIGDQKFNSAQSWQWWGTNSQTFESLSDAITEWNQIKGDPVLRSFSYITGYLAAKGVDIYEDTGIMR